MPIRHFEIFHRYGQTRRYSHDQCFAQSTNASTACFPSKYESNLGRGCFNGLIATLRETEA
jgi:hypothetical protein